MGAMGFGIILVAVWLIDSAVKGRGPLSSLKGILSSTPGSTGADPSSYDGTIPTTDPTQITPSLGSNDAANTAVAYAVAQVGKPYQWGATGPDAYDCSGLCYEAYKAAGITIGRTTYQQILNGSPVTGSYEPGDLLFPDTGHVEMFIGNGQTVQAPHTGAFVEVGPIPTVIAARRIVAGNTSGLSGQVLKNAN